MWPRARIVAVATKTPLCPARTSPSADGSPVLAFESLNAATKQ
jgi:hypothetical protein